MLRVCFAGITGWTAPPMVAAIDAADDLTLTSGVSGSVEFRPATDSANRGGRHADLLGGTGRASCLPTFLPPGHSA
jgi:hypothetical protein